jgi:hypothetical protein
VKIHRNISLSKEAEAFIKERYVEPDVRDFSELRFIPRFIYVIAVTDAHGNSFKDAILGYNLCRTPVHSLEDAIVFSFDGGRKFFAIRFEPDVFDETAEYLFEHFEGVNYILKRFPDGDWNELLSGQAAPRKL